MLSPLRGSLKDTLEDAEEVGVFHRPEKTIGVKEFI